MFSGRKKALAQHSLLSDEASTIFLFFFFFDVASIDFISLFIAFNIVGTVSFDDRLIDLFFFLYKQHARKDEW